jgi:CTP:molybdopterin cytidylyltransferase MocA
MLAAVVLAAGQGLRFGAPKLLLPAGPREVLLTRAVRLALATVERVIVILPQDARLHRWALAGIGSNRLTLLENPDAARGMGTSLALAAHAVRETTDDLLVLPADLPELEIADLRRLMAAFAETPARSAAAAQDAVGLAVAPAVLSGTLLPALMALDADIGARAILRRAGADVTLVAMPGCAGDVDDFAGYRRVARRLGWDRELPQDVTWRDTLPAGAFEAAQRGWRVGGTLVDLRTGAGAGIEGYRGHGLPHAARRIIFGGESERERLQLLRTAALLSLRDESA